MTTIKGLVGVSALEKEDNPVVTTKGNSLYHWAQRRNEL